MKRGNIEHWCDIAECRNLLFFSQLVNELLFDYSIPSNRIATLNTHYLCLDAMSAISSVENKGVPEMTIKPIAAELYSEITKDPVFNDGLETSPLDYFVKRTEERVEPCSNIMSMNYGEIKEAVMAIENVFFGNNDYYVALKNKIITIIKENKEVELQALFRVTKSLLTELRNKGYSLRYIYMLMNELFWNSQVPVKSWMRIHDFFNAFDFQLKEYQVCFRVEKSRMTPFIRHIEGLTCVDTLPPEIATKASSELRKKVTGNAFLIVKQKAVDPYTASEKAIKQLELNVSVYRLHDHKFRYDLRDVPIEVFDGKRSYEMGKRVKTLEHIKMPSTKQIAEGMDLVGGVVERASENVDDVVALLNAIRYHSHSLDSYSEENQLLDLWTIFESVLDVSNKHASDRIQQISNCLIPILKKKYLYQLFRQLADDIKAYDKSIYNEIVMHDVEEATVVRQLCEFILLDENASERERVLHMITDFPLLRERILYYHDNLATPAQVYDFVEKHAKRVRWQIMRIYRNRNLIIHNAERMPYLSLLLENLHSYVDDFLSYAIHSLSNQMTMNSMSQELFAKECKWRKVFQGEKGAFTDRHLNYMLDL